MNRSELKEKELRFLAGEFKKNPQLFQRGVFVDSSQILEKIGIFIPSQENFPLGYIKFWPQDFIVEEISKDEEVQTIKIGPFSQRNKVFSEEDPTVYATLVKSELSTIEAVEEISDLLSLGKDSKGERGPKIQFAGIKDKDALTSQKISFKETNIGNLQKINSPYFFLKNVYSGKGVAEIGSLKGNEFTILVRTDNSFQKGKFLENLKNLEREGFYNFFYLQRFGAPRLVNWSWGLLILKGECEKAILSFLCSPGLRESFYFQKLREEVEKNWPDLQKIEKILEPFPLILKNETKIVNYLKENPKDFIGALNQMPDQVQLWLFAYASLLFNKKLSFYLKKKIEPPLKMPLILGKDREDWLFYKEFLEEDKVLSIPFENLRPFPYVQWKKREIKTREKAKILKTEIIKEGVILNFFLPKAVYATTFLAHLFRLASGLPPKNISPFPVDTKATLGKESLEEVLNRFKDVIYPKTEDFLKKFA